MGNPTHMAGHLMVFKSDDTIVDQPTMLEVTDLTKSGLVEIAFDDRGERVYVRVPLAEMMRIIAAENGSDLS
jgi:hypothetical protein